MTDLAAEPDVTSADAAPALSHRQVLVIFSGLMLGMLLASLDQTIVATALPTIASDLDGLDHISWVVTAYLLATTASTPIYGKLGDLYGRKRIFQAAIVIFLAGSILCGLSQSLGQLVVFRAVQGIGGGGLIVLAQAIIADVVSPRERGRYQGYFGAVFATSSVAGPLLGGFFTDNLSWRWVFYINLPLGALALFVTASVLPASVRRVRARIDYLGSLTLVGAVSCVVLATTLGGTQYAWGSPVIVGLGAGALALLGAFAVVERRAPEPVLPLRLFRNRTFAVAGSVSLVVGVALFGSVSFLPLFLQLVSGASATESGLLLVPLMMGLLTASVFAGRSISRTGRYKVFPVVGTGVASVGIGLLSTMGAGTSLVTTSLYMLVLGLGLGCCMQVLVLITQNSVPASQLGVATSSVNFFRSVGGSIGVALFGSIFSSRLAAGLARDLPGVDIDTGSLTAETVAAIPLGQRATFLDVFAGAITGGFRLAVPVAIVAFGLTWLLREVPLRATSGQAAKAIVDEPMAVPPAGGTGPVGVGTDPIWPLADAGGGAGRGGGRGSGLGRAATPDPGDRPASR